MYAEYRARIDLRMRRDLKDSPTRTEGLRKSFLTEPPRLESTSTIDWIYCEELSFDSISGYVMMDSRERELLEGMGNCYEACHADFENTVAMVGGARGLTPERVKAMLKEMKEKCGGEPEYERLRSRLPGSFPL